MELNESLLKVNEKYNIQIFGLDIDILESHIDSLHIQLTPLKLVINSVRLIVKHSEKQGAESAEVLAQISQTQQKQKQTALQQFDSQFVTSQSTQQSKYFEYLVNYLKEIQIEVGNVLVEYIHISQNQDISLLFIFR